MVDDERSVAVRRGNDAWPGARLAETALAALVEAGVEYRIRKLPQADVEPSSRSEIDIWLPRSSQRAADAALASVGLHVLRAPGNRGHRFYLGFDRGEWLKVDAKFEDRGRPRARGVVERAVNALGRIVPASFRRLGPVVAVLGPDGAGKGSVVDALRQRLPIAVAVVYHGQKRKVRTRVSSKARRTRPAGSLRESAFLLRNYLRSWRALGASYRAAWLGQVVLCDRHPIEVLAVRPPRPRIAERLERLLVRRLTPWPDAIVVLDAPAETLFERKAEHGVEVLERWRDGYRTAFASRATAISTVGPFDETVAEVSAVVWDALAARRRWTVTR